MMSKVVLNHLRITAKTVFFVLVVFGLGYGIFRGLLIYITRDPPIDTTPLPTPNKDAEIVKSVMYYRSPIPFKINWDWLLLDTGKMLQVERGKISPPTEFVVTSIGPFDSYVPGKSDIPTFNVVLDRKNLLVCFDNSCARLIAICPSRTSGKKCEPLHPKQ